MTIDSQRQKVYNWESRMSKHHNLQSNEMTKKECQKFACEIWNKYKNKLCYNFSSIQIYCSQVKTKNARGRGRPCMKSGFWYDGKEKFVKNGAQSFYKQMHFYCT